MAQRARWIWCDILVLIPALAIAARLTQLQIFQHRRLESLADAEAHRESLEIIPRGRILDRSERVLAESLPSWSCFIDPAAVQENRAVSTLAKMLALGPGEIRRKMDSPGRFVWLKRKITPAELKALRTNPLTGVGILSDERRFYPNGDLARGLLGTVGLDGRGLSGIEQAYDAVLRADPIEVRWIRDGAGRRVFLGARQRNAPPPDITLTLDRNIQHFAHAVLREGIARHKPDSALILVQDPRTGDILAAASHPESPLKNQAVQSAYEPGSTYKIVPMAAILEEKIASLEDTVDAESGKWLVSPGVTIKDHEPNAAITISQALERSSNIALAKIGLKLGPEKFYRYSRTFGFGSKTGLSLPGESSGQLKTPMELDRITLANNAFGQGILVTPLQTLCAYSAIANGGLLFEPRIISKIGDKSHEPRTIVRRVASQQTMSRLGRVLRGVVEHGTGITAAAPGYYVAGKTGTAQKIDPVTRRYSKSKYIASFVGYVPAQDPQFAVLVLMDSPRNGYYGSDVAAPLFAKLMRQILALSGIQPTPQIPTNGPPLAAPPDLSARTPAIVDVARRLAARANASVETRLR